MGREIKVGWPRLRGGQKPKRGVEKKIAQEGNHAPAKKKKVNGETIFFEDGGLQF